MKTQEQSAQEILKLLGDLFNDRSIGLYPERNDNGADSYCCPACYATKYILGNASGQERIEFVDHADRCDLNLLYKMYRDYTDAYPQEQDEEQDNSED